MFISTLKNKGFSVAPKRLDVGLDEVDYEY